MKDGRLLLVSFLRFAMEKAIQFVSSLLKSLEEQQTTMTNANVFCKMLFLSFSRVIW